MKNKMIVGLTGQSGAGKSTVAGFLAENGLKIINADMLVAEIYSSGSPCLKTIASCFGNDIIIDGVLNRKILAERAFSSKENTKLLSSIVHPFVTAEFCKAAKTFFASGENIVVYDAPQLFESNFDVACRLIVSVVCSRQTRIQRICARDSITEKEALMRINAQLHEDFFKENSDIILENNGTKQELLQASAQLIERLKQR